MLGAMSMDRLIKHVGPSLIQHLSWSGRINYQLVFPSPVLHLALSYPHNRLQAETRAPKLLSFRYPQKRTWYGVEQAFTSSLTAEAYIHFNAGGTRDLLFVFTLPIVLHVSF